ncbi:MAG: hypothetical protein M1824_005010 [Vezdaea acicularis]|nr:MAG: hypothetical protein M1824_005010 [Vezdaea acicularis]
MAQEYKNKSELTYGGRLSSTASGMPSPAQIPRRPNTVTTSSRDIYATPTPQLGRQSFDLLPHSPRSPTSASSGSAYNQTAPYSLPSNLPYGMIRGPLHLETARLLPLSQSETQTPPLEPTCVLQHMTTATRDIVRPEINAKIEKGFFFTDHEWTSYRRNYFSLTCSYTLRPQFLSIPLYLSRGNGSNIAENILSFAMSISAVVDAQPEKAVELVQHTAKRDRGPQGKPDRIKLQPHVIAPSGLYLGSMGSVSAHYQGSPLASLQEYEPQLTQQAPQPQTVASFERIQFKSATANNGKRRAAQQYYHLVVELYAEVASSSGSENDWVKVATRTSVPMVVRGRSPGHYQDDRRGSSSSSGPSAGGGDMSGGGPIAGTGATTSFRGMSAPYSFVGSSNPGFNGSSYQSSLGLSSQSCSLESLAEHSISSRSSSGGQLDTPLEPILTAEESSAIEEYPGYQYYPSSLFESQMNQTRLGNGFTSFPSAASRHERTSEPVSLSRDLSKLGSKPVGVWPETKIQPLPQLCSRFQGSEASRGFYSNLAS